MGSASEQAGRDEQPVHRVWLSGYCLDRLEVSAGDFSAWLVAGGRAPAGRDPRHLGADGRVEAGREGYPAEGVTWEEARDYCAARGGALPTEAQWEKAARGGCELGVDSSLCDPEDLRAYPWGNTSPSCERANHQLVTPSGPSLCRSDTHPVGALGVPGPYGHLDLAGNVWEYVADAYHPAVYSRERTRRDPGGAPAGDYHVLRGGSWNTFSTNMRAANRFSDSVLGSAAGFRCAWPSAAPTPDPVAPLETVVFSGTVTRGEGVLDGRALYVTAFDTGDLGPQGMPEPGRSPTAEVVLTPGGQRSQGFELPVPAGRSYLLFAAMDGGTGGSKEDYISSSSSGGFGHADAPVKADKDRSGVAITLGPPPGGPPSGGPR
jgi:formylglycine-generating enzyme required for sulfatase activity